MSNRCTGAGFLPDSASAAVAFDPVDVDAIGGAVEHAGDVVPGVCGQQIPGRLAPGGHTVAEAEAQASPVADGQERIGQERRRVGAAGDDGQDAGRLRVDPGRLAEAPAPLGAAPSRPSVGAAATAT